MKCKICGAELKKEGDICKNCYNEYVKGEEIKKELKSEKNILLKLHRKYLPKYQLTRYGDYYILAIVIVISFMVQNQILWTILSIIGMIALLCAALAYNKHKAVNTTCTFYENRVIWKYKDNIKSMDYSNLENVTYYQSRMQKRFNLADVQFRPKKGIYLTNGFEIKNVPDFADTWEKICEIVKSKRDN